MRTVKNILIYCIQFFIIVGFILFINLISMLETVLIAYQFEHMLSYAIYIYIFCLVSNMCLISYLYKTIKSITIVEHELPLF